jgi:eukaryotic-like serine/threonine-protein kinase
MDTASSERGATSLGRYVIYEEIAAGGMATVHFGRLVGDAGFARTVAIKRLHPQYAKDPEFVTMFMDEARVTSRIRHPNVVTTLDVVAQAGELFVIMEYVHGEPLSRLIRASSNNQRRIPPGVVGAIMAGALHGLHAAHEARDELGQRLDVVHRDVSPHNILVGADGVARVLDFGIAKAAGSTSTTREGEIKGKFAYMPPEQLHGELVDRRADIYAAGVVLWEAITGQRLYHGAGNVLDLQRVLAADAEPPSSRVSGVPSSLDQVTMRALSREAGDRYPTAREMAIALEKSIGLSPPSEVSAWVEELAGESLAQRARQITAMEAALPPSAAAKRKPTPGSASFFVDTTLIRAVPPPPPALDDERTLPRSDKIPVIKPRRLAATSRQRIALIAAGVALIGLLAAALLVGMKSPLNRARLAPPAPADSIDERTRGPAQAPLPSASDRATASSDAAEPPPSAEPVQSAEPAEVAKGRQSRPSAVPRPRPSAVRDPCNPPFVIDTLGHKRYKRECL